MINSLIIQPNGKIVIGGNFDSFNGSPRKEIARLNSNGSLDFGFDPGTGFTGTSVFVEIHDIAIQPDGKIVVGGAFNTYNGTARNRIARLNGGLGPEITATVLAASSYCQGQAIGIPFTTTGNFAASNVFTAQLSNSSGSFASPVTLGTLAGTTSGTISATIPAGTIAGTGYRIRVVSSSPAIPGVDNGSNIAINETPQVAANTPTPTICLGSSATLNGVFASSYSWAAGNGLSAQTGATVSATPTTTGTHTYTVTGTSNGCSNTATVALTVNAGSAVTASASNNTICAGQTTSLSAAGATSYNWSNGQAGNIITVSPAASTTYTVTGSSSGCSGTATVIVNVNPAPQLTLSPSPGTICAGQSSTLNASGASSYSWSNGATTASITVSPTATTTYVLTGTSALGCAATASATVTVNPVPTVSAGNATACEGTTATLSATANPGSSFAWTGPNNFASASQNAQLANITTAMAGTYSVTTTLNGCTSTPAIVSVMVNPVPTASFTQQLNGCCDITITNTSTGGATYSYTFGDNSPAVATENPSHQYAVTGTYTITQTVTSAAGCVSTSTQTVSVVNGLEEALAGLIKLYPNPSNGQVTVDLTNVGVAEPAFLELYNVLGQLQSLHTLNPGAPTNLRLVGLAEGVYLVRLTIGDSMIAKQLLLQK